MIAIRLNIMDKVYYFPIDKVIFVAVRRIVICISPGDDMNKESLLMTILQMMKIMMTK